jgi:hypothetical protein
MAVPVAATHLDGISLTSINSLSVEYVLKLQTLCENHNQVGAVADLYTLLAVLP